MIFSHGNPKIYHPDFINPLNKHKMGDLYQRTLQRKQLILDSGFNFCEIWENEWRLLLKNNFIDADQL